MKKFIVILLVILNIIMLFFNIYMIYIISKPNDVCVYYANFDHLERLAFNTPFEGAEGNQEGKKVIEVLDRIVNINEQSIINDTKDTKFIDVVFEKTKINAESIEEITNLKDNIDDTKIYTIVLTYNEFGLINMIEIKEKI